MFTWGIVLVLIGFLAYFSTKMARRDEPEGLQDTGLAIVEFGRAFPQEAIRSLHATADGKAVFVRLHDSKAGFMRNMRSHYACHLIKPGMVRVRNLPAGNGFAVEFLDAPFHNGEFTFANPAEAAEVSLWLLGNYVGHADRPDMPGMPA
ncbi:hypothetical protein ACSV9I_04300 [Rhizobium sp. G187]|uniref:hypothetical protein n=1 Tax=unclassified Rhizobium TaxID=2613769 RepID=UPI0006B8BA01|nr:hypothetical protein [Rhizobium sp. AAP43]KPF41788.1 hypothetical protein IP76_19825 [Rhizobium sp. AAP43]